MVELFQESGNFIYTKSLSKVGGQVTQFSEAACLLEFKSCPNHPLRTGLFMVSLPSRALCPEEIKLTDGSGIKWSFTNDLNPDTIFILLGGMPENRRLLRTAISTTGETQEARELFKLFKKIVTKNSVKVGSKFYVMKDALVKLQQGWRLSQTIDATPDYDLKWTPLTTKTSK